MLLAFDPSDLHPAEPVARIAAAASRFTLYGITDPDDPEFDVAYRLMEGFFGPRREIEPRSTLEDLLRLPHGYTFDGVRVFYHLLVARDETGAVAGVRDCFVSLDDAVNVVVVFLSHSFVVPEHRRSGLAAILRGVPATLGRVAAAEAWGAGDVLLAAEMEPVDPFSPETIIRLLAYGRAGFFVVDPSYLPYLQPDFGDVSAGARPVPLIPVVRWLGEEHRAAVPGAIAYAFDRHLHAVHGRYIDIPQVAALKAFTADAWGGRDPVPVIHLPRSLSEARKLDPILKSRVLPLYTPEILGGPLPDLDPSAEIAALDRIAESPETALAGLLPAGPPADALPPDPTAPRSGA